MSDQKAAGGPIDNRDIDDWKNRFNKTMANTEKFSAPSPPDARPWSTGFFSCFDPVDLCTQFPQLSSEAEIVMTANNLMQA